MPAVARREALIGFYLLYFASVGITLPFLPAYFRSPGFSGAQIGLLLTLPPVAALIFPSLFGHLADRTGRPDRVLSLVAFGALCSFAPLLLAERFGPVIAIYAAYAVFASSYTSLVDSLALHRVAVEGGSYAHLRLFGSIGFVLSSTLFGLAVDAIDGRTVIAAALAIAASAGWSLTVRAKSAPAPLRNPLDGLRLLRDRDLATLLLATCLHWIACAPFHGTFAIHVTALGLEPRVVGLSAGLGVAAEIAVMALYPRVSERIAPRHLLFIAFAFSALRWAGMAVASSGPVLLLLALLHGFTFGAFYVAALGYLGGRVPEGMRASGQALFVAITFGVGGIVGYTTAGALYDLLGGHRLFALAAGLQTLTALLTLRLRPVGEFPGGGERPLPR